MTLNDLGGRTAMRVHLALPDHFTDYEVLDWLGMGIRDCWSETIDRLVSAFASPE